jgi:hypothetical protein
MITLNAYSPTAVELTPAESSLYGQMDRVRQATNAGIRRWVTQWRDLLRGRVLDYGAGKPGTCRIPQPFREILNATDYVPWEPDDPEPSGAFDAILCTQVIQNFDMPHGRFFNFHGLLRNNGHLVLTYPVAWEEIEQEYFRYTQKGLWMLCHKAGLEIVQHETLVRVAIDGSLTLNLVNGLVARRRQ